MMEFVNGSDGEEFPEINDYLKQLKGEEENSIGLSFITDEDDEENVLDIEEIDASDDEKGDSNVALFQKVDLLKDSNSDKTSHPLAHLFDEVERTESKHSCKESNAKSIIRNKTSDTNSKQKSQSDKLFQGLTLKSRKSLQILKQDRKKGTIDQLLAKSEILNSDPSEMFSIQPQVSKRKSKKLKKQDQEKTKGDKWFGLPATEVTDDVKRDLELLQMRSVLDPKRFYKKNDLQVIPKYFQIGKVMDSPRDFYNHRLKKKDRKQTLVDELMADAAFNRYNKNKYAEILKEKEKTHYKAWRQAKRLKKKK